MHCFIMSSKLMKCLFFMLTPRPCIDTGQYILQFSRAKIFTLFLAFQLHMLFIRLEKKIDQTIGLNNEITIQRPLGCSNDISLNITFFCKE